MKRVDLSRFFPVFLAIVLFGLTPVRAEDDLIDRLGPDAAVIIMQGERIETRYGPAGHVPMVGVQSLSILSAYRDAIRSGKIRRNDMIFLEDRSRSPKSGNLHRWPERIALSVHSLVALMMQDNDDTAMDALTHILGREAIEPHAFDNVPFLTTREFMILQASEGLREAWSVSDAPSRDAILDEADRQGLPLKEDLLDRPVDDMAWTWPLDGLCSLALGMADAPEMTLTDDWIVREDVGLLSVLGWQNGRCVAASVPLEGQSRSEVMTALRAALKP